MVVGALCCNFHDNFALCIEDKLWKRFFISHSYLPLVTRASLLHVALSYSAMPSLKKTFYTRSSTSTPYSISGIAVYSITIKKQKKKPSNKARSLRENEDWNLKYVGNYYSMFCLSKVKTHPKFWWQFLTKRSEFFEVRDTSLATDQTTLECLPS